MADQLPAIAPRDVGEGPANASNGAYDSTRASGDHGAPPQPVHTAGYPSPWRLPGRQAWFLTLALCAGTLVLFVRLFQLDSLQNEFYGDIELLYRYVMRIRAGEWPFDFVLSTGPLYHYLIVPIVAIAGMSYFGLKLASAIVSLAVLCATYALGRRLIDDYFALLAFAIAGVSSWLLIWSRLGNSQILVPLLTTGALWLAVRVAQRGRLADVVACAIVSALGLYVYPQSFVLPGVTLATLLGLRWAGQRVAWSRLGLFVLVTVVCAIPFATIVARSPDNFTTGYIGGKFYAGDGAFQRLLSNLVSAALAFHIRGDSIFRSNPSELPHLDPISGILFLVGIAFWLLPARRRWSPVLLVPLVLLQLPSALVLARPDEVPSAGRTLGVAPIACLLVASGIWWLAHAIPALGRLRLGPATCGLLLAVVCVLNMQRYFGTYIEGLPYHNTSIGAHIAAYADSLPPDTQVYLVGCCWEASMPEAPFVRLVMARPQRVRELDPHALTCDRLRFLDQPAVLIWSFRDQLPAPQLATCGAWLPEQRYLSPQGWPVFHAAPLRVDLPLNPAAGLLPAPIDRPGEQLHYSAVEVGGQVIGVRHSPADLGQAIDLFDHNLHTLLRGRDANPLVIELRFDPPRRLRSISLDLATTPDVRVTVELSVDDNQLLHVDRAFRDLPPDPHVELPLPSDAPRVAVARIVIEDRGPMLHDAYHIHVREVQLR